MMVMRIFSPIHSRFFSIFQAQFPVCPILKDKTTEFSVEIFQLFLYKLRNTNSLEQR